ncbi:MAG: hypothetical protein D6728_13425 [Cyanobacteria bacterium J055]|nr:MAG: hypothetical protein D6728_13425 [Cyanobacteria bacterium J055]
MGKRGSGEREQGRQGRQGEQREQGEKMFAKYPLPITPSEKFLINFRSRIQVSDREHSGRRSILKVANTIDRVWELS